MNELGEKEIVKTSIVDEYIPEFAEAGRRAFAGKDGYVMYIEPSDRSEQVLIYTPVSDANYSIGLVVPFTQLMAPVYQLRYLYVIGLILSIFLIIGVSMFKITERNFDYFKLPILDSEFYQRRDQNNKLAG